MNAGGDRAAEPILISALNHYVFCPRRCALIHVEHVFDDNAHTARGSREHQRVDQVEHETIAGVRVERALPIWSDELGISGRADVVEFHPDGTIFPVEYKKGPLEVWENDDIQLAAQALCLEAMFDKPVARGAIFHITSRRRREVAFDIALRARTARICAEVHALLRAGRTPPPVLHARCDGCSLRQRCLPERSNTQPDWLFTPMELRS